MGGTHDLVVGIGHLGGAAEGGKGFFKFTGAFVGDAEVIPSVRGGISLVRGNLLELYGAGNVAMTQRGGGGPVNLFKCIAGKIHPRPEDG